MGTDPLTGRVDVTILTTGQSSSGRKRRQEVAAGLKALLRKKTKVGSINIDPRRRRRLKLAKKKTSDYLHLQYLTIYFPVPLGKVYLLTMVMTFQVVIIHAACVPYSMCRNRSI